MEAAALPRPRLASRGINLPAAVLRLRSDEQLVALFRGGSDDAFIVIHDRYRARLLAYARQMLGGSQADAEDVLQDVFVRAHAGLRRTEAPIALRAWLYRIAHNRCIDAIRRPGPMPAEITPGAEPAFSRGAQHDPPVEAERSEDLQRLVRDLLDLPEQQRSALLMRELQGLSYDELASSLGVSVGAVKSLLVRARGGVLSASVARAAPCAEICVELTEAYDRGVRPSGQVRRHLRECAACSQHRVDLRNQSRQIAALGPPAGLFGLLSGLGGGTGGGLAVAGGGGAGVVAGGGGAAAACGIGAVAVGKVAAIVCAVALVGGAGSALTAVHHAAPARPRVVAVAPPSLRAPTAATSRHPAARTRTSAPAGATHAPASLTLAAPACQPAAAAAPPAAVTDPSAAATPATAPATSADTQATGAAAACATVPTTAATADAQGTVTPAPASGQSPAAATGPSAPAAAAVPDPDPDQTTGATPTAAATTTAGADPAASTSTAAAVDIASTGGTQAPTQ